VPGAVPGIHPSDSAPLLHFVSQSLFYEKFRFSGRVSYQWRDDWLETPGGFGLSGAGDESGKGYQNLDIALRYTVNDHFTLYADFANLTDATCVAFQGDEGRPTEVEQIGSRALYGVRCAY